MRRQAGVKALGPLDQQRHRVLRAERAQRSHHQIGVQAGQVAELTIAHDEHVVDAGGETERPGEEGGSVGRLIEQRRGVGAGRQAKASGVRALGPARRSGEAAKQHQSRKPPNRPQPLPALR